MAGCTCITLLGRDVRVWMWILICCMTGAAGVGCIGLYHFLQRVEASSVCEGCDKCSECIAQRPVFKDSNFLTEFMLLTYLKVYRSCQNIHHVPVHSRIAYLLINTILISILYWSGEDMLIRIVFSVSAAMLLALSVVDWNTQYIPVEYTGVILICGLIRLFADRSDWIEYVIGLIAVSGFLYIVSLIGARIMTGRHPEDEIDGVMGDGDIKLMAATGLLIGWKLNFLALGIGCIIGSVVHLILMKIKGSDRRLALGPYLSLGVYITMICGEQLVSWYLNMIGPVSYYNNF